MKKVQVGAIAGTVLLGLTISGCASGGSTAGSSEPDRTLTIALASAPTSLDPAIAATGVYSNFIEPAYASLLNRAVDGEIIEGLADEWGYVGEGNTVFEVSLRDDLKWADGTEISADHVVASMDYFKTGSGPSAPYLAPMSFEAVDEGTIRITSETANPMIAELLTPEFHAGAIISPVGLEDPAALGETTFGAGQYVYDASQSTSGDHYVYTPNEHYWDQGAIQYESITIRVISNTNSAVQALTSGQVDFIAGSPEAAAAVEGDEDIETKFSTSLWAGLYLLDRDGQVVPALADVRVRQALNYAVDREAITAAVYGDFGVSVDQPMAPGFQGYSEDAAGTYPYDPDKARDLLAEAGYADGFTIPVNYGSFDQENTKVVQAVQGQLAEIGVDLELKAATNFGGWVDDLVSQQHAATLLSPGAGGSIYFIAQSTFLPGGILNIFGAENAELTEAYNAFTVAPAEEMEAAARKITEIAVDQALALPVAANSTIVVYNTKLQGVEFTTGSGLPTYVTAWTSK